MNVYSIKHLALKHLKDCRHANILTRGHRNVEILLKIKKTLMKTRSAGLFFPNLLMVFCSLLKQTIISVPPFLWSNQEVLPGIKI